jgi:uncharacterized protein with ParB-like and HNH nuclease domain
MNLIVTPARSKAMENGDHLTERIESEEQDRQVSLPSYEILTYPADFTLEVLVGKWNKEEVEVPELQRGYVWTQAQASKLIESFLLGLPVPPVYFYQDRDTNSLLVIDGHQRLRSIVYFFSGLFGEAKKGKRVSSFNLTDLDEDSPYLGTTFQQLEKRDEATFNRLKNSVLRAFIMKQLDPADDTSIFQVFERLNSGGVVLLQQEIRNCIYHGDFNDVLKELNKYGAWREVLGRRPEDKRMRDIELILRFFALFHNVSHYERPMKQFLNKFMKGKAKLSDAKQKQYRELFKNTADAIVRYLGKRPFHIRKGLNAAVYDSVFVAFARHLEALSDEPTEAQIARMKAKFDRLIHDEQYDEWVISHTTDKDVVPNRIKKAEQILFG